MNISYFMPARVITGKGVVSGGAFDISQFGKRCLIATGNSSAKKSGALRDVVKLLEDSNVEFTVYDKISQNPTVFSCIEAAEKADDFGAEFIIGIGGGSPLDASKAIAVLAGNRGMSEEVLYSLKWENDPLPVIAVGTTAGTGSEVTPVAVLTNSKGLKKSIRDDRIYPALSLGDPTYTLSLPDRITRSTAIDAFAHCVESFFNKSANDISKTFALRGTKMLVDIFKKINESGTASLTFEDRETLYNASIYGGLAISVTGTAFPHALGYFLSEAHDVPHGTACAVFLPAFIEWSIGCMPSLAEEFFKGICSEKSELLSLIKAVTPEINVTVSDEERKELYPRWIGNRGLKKTWGDITPEYVDLLIKDLFGE
ncbi:MAG: iron-containing alcohol dehydrogenase [Clostridiales bacterium]|nr:iron-containing alcohol dehydrogenase [Clostridiales bacterium]